MSPEANPEEIKALIFKDKKDFYKASEALYREHMRRAGINPTIDNITALQGEKKGFHYVMLMVPASLAKKIENLGINYVPLGKKEATQFLTQKSKEFLRDNGGGLEYIC